MRQLPRLTVTLLVLIVAAISPTFASAPRNWSVFNADGRWLGEVVLPEDLEVYEIGEDYVLGKETDEFDVEYVRVYRIRKNH